MKALKVLSVIGTRPEAIKMAPVIKVLSASPRVRSTVCVTGQHRQMLDSVLSLFRITPEFDLNIMKTGQNLTDITCAVLPALRDILQRHRPDILLVQGDTTTTMVACLAAFYEKIPVGHVEAGLRTGDQFSPWPEENNRRIASVLSALHFAPTKKAKKNLLQEGVDRATIFVTGNTVIDSLLEVLQGIKNDAQFIRHMHEAFSFLGDDTNREIGKNLILVTGHRRESFGAGFENICLALKRLALHDDVRIVYPVHLNPNVREPVYRILGNLPNVELLDPLDYRQFVYFMSRSRLILTDSGGVQEEAPSLGTPVLVMRDVTERSEGVDAGVVKLVGTSWQSIVAEADYLLSNEEAFKSMSKARNPYGDGKASLRILEAILGFGDFS